MLRKLSECCVAFRLQSSPARIFQAGLLTASLLSLGACTKEETVAPDPAAEKKAEAPAAPGEPAAKPAEAAPVASAPAAPTSAGPTASAWGPVKAPSPTAAREGSPLIVASFSGNSLVPIASRRADVWTVEEVMSLDTLPEGKMGKDAAPEVLVAWWNRLDLQPGDVFILQGSKGARGTFITKRELASSDRGGCMGLVIGIPGDVKWTVKPSGSTRGSADEEPGETIWAIRGAFEPFGTALGREPSENERLAAKTLLETQRKALKEGAPKLAGDATWQECDSLNDPMCKGRRTAFMPLDLEADGVAEAVATVQLRSSVGAQTLETRVILGLTPAGGVLLGRWDTKKEGDERLPPAFAGAVDVTGDGRAELFFRRVVNETENWEVFQAAPDKPGTWSSLFKTAYEGC